MRRPADTTSTPVMSTPRLSSSFLMSSGDYTKELEELKKLLQKMTEELKACCSNQLVQDRSFEASEQVCEELLDDVKGDLFEISRDLEESGVQDKTFGVTDLRQIAEENNREFLASIRQAEEDRTQAVREENLK